MRLSLLALKNNFELWIPKSNKNLYSVQCIHPSCKWVVRATRMKGCWIFMISRCMIEHTCLVEVLNLDRRRTSEFVIENLIKYKFGVGPDDCLHYIVDDMRWNFGVC